MNCTIAYFATGKEAYRELALKFMNLNIEFIELADRSRIMPEWYHNTRLCALTSYDWLYNTMSDQEPQGLHRPVPQTHQASGRARLPDQRWQPQHRSLWRIAAAMVRGTGRLRRRLRRRAGRRVADHGLQELRRHHGSPREIVRRFRAANLDLRRVQLRLLSLVQLQFPLHARHGVRHRRRPHLEPDARLSQLLQLDGNAELRLARPVLRVRLGGQLPYLQHSWRRDDVFALGRRRSTSTARKLRPGRSRPVPSSRSCRDGPRNTAA